MHGGGAAVYNAAMSKATEPTKRGGVEPVKRGMTWREATAGCGRLSRSDSPAEAFAKLATNVKALRMVGAPPTADELRLVSEYTAVGVPLQQIAACIRGGISVSDLQEYFERELSVGPIDVNYRVAKALLAAALGGDVAAMKWWTQTRMGWVDAGKAKEVDATRELAASIDPTKLSDRVLEELIYARSCVGDKANAGKLEAH